MRTVKSNRTLERDLMRLLKGSVAAAPICLASMILCFAAAAFGVVPIDYPRLATHSGDWSFVATIGLWIGVPASIIVSLCALSVPRDLKLRVLLGGSVITGLLTAWYVVQLGAAMGAC